MSGVCQEKVLKVDQLCEDSKSKLKFVPAYLLNQIAFFFKVIHIFLTHWTHVYKIDIQFYFKITNFFVIFVIHLLVL